MSAFETTEMPPPAIYEEKWFVDVARIVAALLAVILVLMLAVRPLIKRMRDPTEVAKPQDQLASPDQAGENAGGPDGEKSGASPNMAASDASEEGASPPGSQTSFETLPERIALARQLASAQPDRAVEALQRMLESSPETPEGASA